MIKRTVIELLALKLSGEANRDDLKELEELITKNPDYIYHQEIFQELFQKDKNATNLTPYYDRHRLKYQDQLVFANGTVKASKYIKFNKQFAIASCLLIIFIASTFFIYHFTGKPLNDLVYNAKAITSKGVRKSLTLPDGTKVWLNSGSEIFYNTDMDTKKVRTVKLIGEAFFDVAHNKARPFIIHTDKISIKVLGTAFNVKAYPTDKETETTLMRGSIELSVNDRKIQKVILKPHEKFALIDNSAKQSIKQITGNPANEITMVMQNVVPVNVAGKEYTEEISWVDDQLVFKGESFEELVPKLERWFNVKITVKNEDVYKYHFTGIFTNEDLTQALTAMKLIKQFNFKIENNDVKIY